MTSYKPIVTGGFTLPTIEREAAPHRCGKCFNPFLGGRADCVNAPKPAEPAIDGFFTNEEMAALIEEWSK